MGIQTSAPCDAHMHCSKETKPQFVPPPLRSRHQGRQVCSLSRLLRCPGCAGLRVPAGANFAPAKLRQKQIVRLNVAGKEESPGRLAEPGALSTGTAWLRHAARPNQFHKLQPLSHSGAPEIGIGWPQPRAVGAIPPKWLVRGTRPRHLAMRIMRNTLTAKRSRLRQCKLR